MYVHGSVGLGLGLIMMHFLYCAHTNNNSRHQIVFTFEAHDMRVNITPGLLVIVAGFGLSGGFTLGLICSIKKKRKKANSRRAYGLSEIWTAVDREGWFS